MRVYLELSEAERQELLSKAGKDTGYLHGDDAYTDCVAHGLYLGTFAEYLGTLHKLAAQIVNERT